MTALALEWFWWIFATFGIVGIILIWIFAPSVAALVVKAVVGLFQFLFGYRIGCALIAGVACLLIADYHRAKFDEADWQKRIATFEAAQASRDKQITADVRAEVTQELTEAAAAQQESKKDVDDFEKATPTDVKCLVGDRAGELQYIAGQARSKPAKRVPAAPRRSAVPKDHQRFGLPELITRGAGSTGGSQPTH